MSKYSDDMKKALVDYKAARTAAEARYNEIKVLYGDEAQTRERERQEKKLKAARSAAETAIQTAHRDGRYIVEQWGKPNGSELTDDMKLFEAGLVTPEVFDQLKERYHDNATMLAAIKAQGEKLNRAAQQEADKSGDFFAGAKEPYKVRDIVTAADKVKNWDKLKAQALDVLDMIDGTGNYQDSWNRSLGAALGEQTIEHFGEGF